MKNGFLYLAMVSVVCINDLVAQERLIPCYLCHPNIQTTDSLKDGDESYNMRIRYISDSEFSIGPVFNIDTSENCRFITFMTDSHGNWYIKSEGTYFIFYNKEKDYLADCCMPECETTLFSKRHQLIFGTEHLYPFEILFWGVTSCDTPTYLFHEDYGIVGTKDNHEYFYFRKDFIEYLLQKGQN
jgi:hypothetical protein